MGRPTICWIITALITALLISSCSDHSALAGATSPPLPSLALSPPSTRATPPPAYPVALPAPLPLPPYPIAPPVLATSTSSVQALPPEQLIAQTVHHLAEEPLLSSRQLCRPDHPSALYTAESADRRYHTFTYQYETLIFVTCVLDTQSSTFFSVGRGVAIEFAWSPADDYLLVNEEALHHRTYVINATTGVTVELPIHAVWGATVYDPHPMGVALDGAWSPTNSYSGMAWSPDGSRLAIDTKDSVYLFQTTKLWQKGGETAIERVITVPLINRPDWSTDGEFLLSVKVIENDDGTLHPSSMYQIQNVRINTRTGAIQEVAH